MHILCIGAIDPYIVYWLSDIVTSSELLTNSEDTTHYTLPNAQRRSLKATYQFMLVLKMTGAVCEVKTKICVMLESMQVSSVNSEVL